MMPMTKSLGEYGCEDHDSTGAECLAKATNKPSNPWPVG